MLASLAGCDVTEECTDSECSTSSDREDTAGPSSPDFRRFEIEVIGEGRVAIDNQTCTTADGICQFDLPVGSVVSLGGEFSFVAESDDTVQEGRCSGERSCRLVLNQGVHLVAEIDATEQDTNFDDHTPIGLLPGQPGIIIDTFGTPYSRLELSAAAVGGLTD